MDTEQQAALLAQFRGEAETIFKSDRYRIVKDEAGGMVGLLFTSKDDALQAARYISWASALGSRDDGFDHAYHRGLASVQIPSVYTETQDGAFLVRVFGQSILPDEVRYSTYSDGHEAYNPRNAITAFTKWLAGRPNPYKPEDFTGQYEALGKMDAHGAELALRAIPALAGEYDRHTAPDFDAAITQLHGADAATVRAAVFGRDDDDDSGFDDLVISDQLSPPHYDIEAVNDFTLGNLLNTDRILELTNQWWQRGNRNRSAQEWERVVTEYGRFQHITLSEGVTASRLAENFAWLQGQTGIPGAAHPYDNAAFLFIAFIDWLDRHKQTDIPHAHGFGEDPMKWVPTSGDGNIIQQALHAVWNDPAEFNWTVEQGTALLDDDERTRHPGAANYPHHVTTVARAMFALFHVEHILAQDEIAPDAMPHLLAYTQAMSSARDIMLNMEVNGDDAERKIGYAMVRLIEARALTAYEQIKDKPELSQLAASYARIMGDFTFGIQGRNEHLTSERTLELVNDWWNRGDRTRTGEEWQRVLSALRQRHAIPVLSEAETAAAAETFTRLQSEPVVGRTSLSQNNRALQLVSLIAGRGVHDEDYGRFALPGHPDSTASLWEIPQGYDSNVVQFHHLVQAAILYDPETFTLGDANIARLSPKFKNHPELVALGGEMTSLIHHSRWVLESKRKDESSAAYVTRALERLEAIQMTLCERYDVGSLTARQFYADAPRAAAYGLHQIADQFIGYLAAQRPELHPDTRAGGRPCAAL